MTNGRPPRLVEVLEVTCYYCCHTVELPVSAAPHRCSNCDSPLIIEWGERPSLLRRLRGVRSASANGERPRKTK